MSSENREPDLGSGSTGIETGEYPFPLSKGKGESEYITWLRNHSDYMAQRGFLDYMRAVGVLVRGILVNFMALIPCLLILSLGVAWFYEPFFDSRKPIKNLNGDTLEYEPGAGPKLLDREEKAEIQTWSKKYFFTKRHSYSRLLVTVEGASKRDLLAIEPPAETPDPTAIPTEIEGDKDEVLDGSDSTTPGAIQTWAGITKKGKNLYFMRKEDTAPTMIGSVEQATGSLKIDFNEDSTPKAIAELVRSISYAYDQGAEPEPEDEQIYRKVKFQLMELKEGESESNETPGALVRVIPPIQSSSNLTGATDDDGFLPKVGNVISIILSVVGGILGWFSDFFGKQPLFLTSLILGFFYLLVLLFPVGSRLSRILGYRKIKETGRGSSVKKRDLVERLFGASLLAILAGVGIGTLPYVVDLLHRLNLNWKESVAAAVAIFIILVCANKLLSGLDGAKKALMTLLIAMAGLLAPFLVVVNVIQYLAYEEHGLSWQWFLLLIIPGILLGAIGLAWIAGAIKRSISAQGLFIKLPLFGLLIVVTSILVPIFAAFVFTFDESMVFIKASNELNLESSNRENLTKLSIAGQDWLGAADRKAGFIFILAVGYHIWLFCRLTVDINSTSVHGLYRDRLASAYLVGKDTDRQEVDIEEDVNLNEICLYETLSTSPYHLVNVALNLQGSKSPDIRDRQSDFFFFSKKFVGGHRTGYCDTETMESVHPSMNLATAMAISAAAASPNMGRGTSPAKVAFMTLLNIRLGYWLPNPGVVSQIEFNPRNEGKPEHSVGDELKNSLDRAFGKHDEPKTWRQIKAERRKNRNYIPGRKFTEVLTIELDEILKRRKNVTAARKNSTGRLGRRNMELLAANLRKLEENSKGKELSEDDLLTAAYNSDLVGLGFSGGGIRSATINLGISQVLHNPARHLEPGKSQDESGIFEQVDYMSTVSGGGYLGSSLSTLMRFKTRPFAEKGGRAKASIAPETGNRIVTVDGRNYEFSEDAQLNKKFSKLNKEVSIGRGHPLLRNAYQPKNNTYWRMFKWRVRPAAFLRELNSKLNEVHKWVNLSDGGHIENMAAIELLRRRCKYVIVGDGEADPTLNFYGLATLVRYALIDLDTIIKIDVEPIRLDRSEKTLGEGKGALSREHFAFGTIEYPNGKKGYLLYLKSSYTGDENVVIQEYRHRNPDFPHQTTADQSFDEGQFEAYRAIGQHIGEKAVDELLNSGSEDFWDKKPWKVEEYTKEATKAFADKFFPSSDGAEPDHAESEDDFMEGRKTKLPKEPKATATPPSPEKPLSLRIRLNWKNLRPKSRLKLSNQIHRRRQPARSYPPAPSCRPDRSSLVELVHRLPPVNPEMLHRELPKRRLPRANHHLLNRLPRPKLTTGDSPL